MTNKSQQCIFYVGYIKDYSTRDLSDFRLIVRFDTSVNEQMLIRLSVLGAGHSMGAAHTV